MINFLPTIVLSFYMVIILNVSKAMDHIPNVGAHLPVLVRGGE